MENCDFLFWMSPITFSDQGLVDVRLLRKPRPPENETFQELLGSDPCVPMHSTSSLTTGEKNEGEVE